MTVQPPAEAPAAEPEPEEQPFPRGTMTLLGHLQELRTRVMWCAGALIFGLIVSFYPLTPWTIDFLAEPARDNIPGFRLTQIEPLEYWSSYFRVSLLLAIGIAMPMWVYQAFAFVSPGLKPAERRWLIPIVVGAFGAFIGGAAFCYYFALPPALQFLVDEQRNDVESLIRIRSYIDFVTRFIFATAIVFELPLVVMGFAKIGVVTSRQLLGWWRYAIVGSFVVAAIITPTIDPVTQSMVGGPMVVLYFVGVALAKLVEGNAFIKRDAS